MSPRLRLFSQLALRLSNLPESERRFPVDISARFAPNASSEVAASMKRRWRGGGKGGCEGRRTLRTGWRGGVSRGLIVRPRDERDPRLVISYSVRTCSFKCPRADIPL
eukprot:scaffold137887_cov34-Tisochrysis_lutea.AAC.1